MHIQNNSKRHLICFVFEKLDTGKSTHESNFSTHKCVTSILIFEYGNLQLASLAKVDLLKVEFDRILKTA